MSDRELPSGYEPRSIQFWEVWRPHDWTIKVYAISSGKDPDPDLIAAAKDLALQRLPFPAVTDTRYGLGLLIVQQGNDQKYIRVGWWIRQHVLKSYLYSSDPGGKDPVHFSDVTSTGVTASLWDLHVMHFERTAWINSVVNRADGPDGEEYLLQRFRREV